MAVYKREDLILLEKLNNLISHNLKKVDINITNNLEVTLPSARNIFPMKKNHIFSWSDEDVGLLVFRDRIFVSSYYHSRTVVAYSHHFRP